MTPQQRRQLQAQANAGTLSYQSGQARRPAQGGQRGQRARPARVAPPAPAGPQTPRGTPGSGSDAIPPQQAPGGGGSFSYSPTQESQFNQPYQDLAAAGAYGSLADVLGRQGQQGQMADLYGQGAATNLGGAQAGMNQLAPLGGQYTGASGNFLAGAQNAGQGVYGLGQQATGVGAGTLGAYGQLMNPNLQIQQNLGNQIQRIQSGADSGFDPMLDQQLQNQERDLRSQLMRSLGPDYATSSAGIEALGRFNQQKQATLGSSRFNQLQGLLGQQQAGMGNLAGQFGQFGGFGQGAQGQQFGQGLAAGQFGAGIQGQQFGQGAQLGQMYGTQAGQLFDQAQALRNNQLAGGTQMLNQLGQIQQLYGNIPTTMGQFGTAMGNYGQGVMGATGPYQQDRFGQLQASYAPTPGDYMGRKMADSGNRWASIGSSMMGGGGGGGGSLSSGDFYQNTGMGNPNSFNPYGAQFQ